LIRDVTVKIQQGWWVLAHHHHTIAIFFGRKCERFEQSNPHTMVKLAHHWFALSLGPTGDLMPGTKPLTPHRRPGDFWGDRTAPEFTTKEAEATTQQAERHPTPPFQGRNEAAKVHCPSGHSVM
jgi:hypothetical protein